MWGGWIVSYGVEQLCFVAVNLFALISGFVSYGKNFKIKNIIGLWIEVVFYSVGLTLILITVKGTDVIPLRRVISSALPILTNKYWYFTSYVFLFFLMPALNLLIEKTTKKYAVIGIGIILLLCSTDGIVTDMFKLNGGYSPLWLAVVYTLGAFFKKYQTGKKTKKRVDTY